MILGYPGRTERYLSSVAVADRQTVVFPMRYRLYSGIIEVLQRASERDEQTALQFASMIKSLANVEKNALGMIKGLARNGVVARKLREEAAFRTWIAASPERVQEYGNVLDEVMAMDRDASKTLQKEQVLRLLAGNLSRFVGTLVAACADVSTSDSTEDAALSQRARAMLGGRRMAQDFDEVQVPILEILLDEARALPQDQRLAGTEMLTGADEKRSTREKCRPFWALFHQTAVRCSSSLTGCCGHPAWEIQGGSGEMRGASATHLLQTFESGSGERPFSARCRHSASALLI